MWSEARIVRQRNAARLKREAVNMQAVIASVLSKKAGKHLQDLIKRLDESE